MQLVKDGQRTQPLRGRLQNVQDSGVQMNRGKIDIVVDILSAMEYKTMIITHLMYKSNVNITTLKKLLKPLMQQGYVEQIMPIKKHGWANGKTCKRPQYRLTSKGHEFLKQTRLVKEMQNNLQTAFK